MDTAREVENTRNASAEPYTTDDIYEAAYITIETAIEPRIVRVTPRRSEFRFDPSRLVTRAVANYHAGGTVEAKRLARSTRNNFETIRNAAGAVTS